MKKIVLAASIAALGMGLAGTANAATGSTATGTGSANATVVAPLQIAHTSGAALNFGSFTAGTGGTVTVSAAGAVSAGGDVGLVTGSTTSADAFTVTGSASRAFTITPSASNTVTTGGASPATMTFTVSAPSSASLSAAGSYTLNVGGALTVGANQAAGAYSGNYTVTVAYQ